jgi:hypothetical protein
MTFNCSKLNTPDCPLVCPYHFCCNLCERSCTGRNLCHHASTFVNKESTNGEKQNE